MHDDARRDEHEPAPRELVPAAPRPHGASGGERAQRSRRAPTDGRPAATARSTTAPAQSIHVSAAASEICQRWAQEVAVLVAICGCLHEDAPERRAEGKERRHQRGRHEAPPQSPRRRLRMRSPAPPARPTGRRPASPSGSRRRERPSPPRRSARARRRRRGRRRGLCRIGRRTRCPSAGIASSTTPIHAPRSNHGTNRSVRCAVDRSGTGDSLAAARSRRAGLRGVTMIGMVESETAVEAGAPQRAAWLTSGATVGVGSLPHRNARQAAEFVLASYDIPTMPSLPRRSPAESPIAQALIGVCGVTLGQYGTVAIDVAPARPVGAGVHRPRARSLHRVPHVPRRGGRARSHRAGGMALRRAGLGRRGAAACRCCAGSGLRSRSRRDPGPHPRRRRRRRRGPARVAATRRHRRAVRRRGRSGGRRRSHPTRASTSCRRRWPRSSPWPRSACIAAATSTSRCCSPPVRTSCRFRCRRRSHRSPATSTASSPAAAGSSGARSPPVVRSASPPTAPGTGSPRCGTTSCSAGARPIRLREQSLLTADCGLGSHGVPVAERVSQSLRDIGRAVRSDATAAKLVLGG